MHFKKLSKTLMALTLSVAMCCTSISISPGTTLQAETLSASNENSTPDIGDTSSKITTSENGFNVLGSATSASVTENKVNLTLSTGESIRITFYKDGVFRYYMDPSGSFQENPTPRSSTHTTLIVDKTEAEYKAEYGTITPTLKEESNSYVISTKAVELTIDKATSKIKIYDKLTGKYALQETEPLKYSSSQTVQTLATEDNEYFYGGGHQNGRFSHKNTTINIKNENNWVDGGVASPNPFYVSTNDYGVLRHTWEEGVYDFSKTATFSHKESRFDAFYFVGESVPQVMNAYTELTGAPVLLPEYAFYLGHANAYNRDMVTDPVTGERYLESLMNDGVRVLNAYQSNDMPFGWFLPNDGYGAGYGQTTTFDGDLANLKAFIKDANGKNVEVGLWTQAAILPKDLNNPQKNERDITKEVGVAGVHAVKTDVAWVGAGYSMALQAVETAAKGIEDNSDYRPFVVSLDGWAGTQRYASVWTGDETGGQWEYIRFMIPTYIGAGLSGQPNVGSDADGIFGGKNAAVQTRDYQWKAFSPVIIDMDGWGSTIKNPFAFGEDYTSINRMYLKLKAQMLPYTYSLAATATKTSMPMIRAMMLEYPDDKYCLGTNTEYQYMYGDNLLIAPIYDKEENNAEIRNDIYLPDENQTWIDYFTGEQYTGGVVLNNFDAPIWKTPVFVKNGAIIPMTVENNSSFELTGKEDRIFDVYPDGTTSFTLYEDDGYSKEYKNGESASTIINSIQTDADKKAVIKVNKTTGSYHGMENERGTQFIVNVQEEPTSLNATVGGANVTLTKVTSKEAFESGSNVYYYNAAPDMNHYATPESSFASKKITTTPKVSVKIAATDTTKNAVVLTVNGFNNIQDPKADGATTAPLKPTLLKPDTTKVTDSSIELSWEPVTGATSYELLIDGIVYSNLFTNYVDTKIVPDTEYTYQLRARNSKGTSEWSSPVIVRSALDPYRNVPKDMTATWSGGTYSGEPNYAVDGNSTTQFHSSAGLNGNTFNIDMKKVYKIESLDYLPREDQGNGTVTNMDIYASIDGNTYKEILSNVTFTYDTSQKGVFAAKSIAFPSTFYARYIRLIPTKSVGNFFTAYEIRPFMEDKTIAYPSGDLDHSGDIGEGDLTFLQNYVGIQKGEAMWDYASIADINFNEVIDAYDFAYITSQLEGGVASSTKEAAGSMMIVPSVDNVVAGETFTLDIYGIGLSDINGFSTMIPLDTTNFEHISTKPGYVAKNMLDYSAIRTDNGISNILIMLANVGDKKSINGSGILATITLKAKSASTLNFTLNKVMMLGRNFTKSESVSTIVDSGKDFVTKTPETKMIPSSTITVSDNKSENIWQSGCELEKLLDGNRGSYSEFLWDMESNYVNGALPSSVSMPVDINFTLANPSQISQVVIYKRAGGNGSLKDVTLTGYKDGVVTDLGTKTAGDKDTLVTFDVNGVYDQITVTPLSVNASNQKMLTLGEVEFYTSNEAKVSGIEVASSCAIKVNVGSYTFCEANIVPADALNPFYRVSCDNGNVAIFRTEDNLGNTSYLLKGISVGTSNITLTTVDGSYTTSYLITVMDGSDKSNIENLIQNISSYSPSLFTPDSYIPLLTAIDQAKAVSGNTLATSEQIEGATVSLENAVAGLTRKSGNTSEIIPKTGMSLIDKSSEADYEDATSDLVIDGKLDNYWHSDWTNNAVMPQYVVVDLGSTYYLNQIDYYPRGDGGVNGTVLNYELALSSDNVTFRTAASGSFKESPSSRDARSIKLPSYQEARYVKFIATEGYGGLFASCGELDFYGSSNDNNSSDAELLLALNATKTQLDNSKSALVLGETAYKSESWDAFIKAYNALKNLSSDSLATTITLTEACVTLEKAIAGLALKDNTEEPPVVIPPVVIPPVVNPPVESTPSNNTTSGSTVDSNTSDDKTTDGNAEKLIPATNITISSNKIILGSKEKVSLKVEKYPVDSTDIITYTSNKKSVATVNKYGVVTGIKVGSAVITATSTSGKKTTCKVTVNPAPTKITLSTKVKTLKKGKSFQLKVLLPKNTVSYQMKYTSSKNSVATVSADGIVKGLKSGKVEITVTTFNKKKAVCIVTVTK